MCGMYICVRMASVYVFIDGCGCVWHDIFNYILQHAPFLLLHVLWIKILQYYSPSMVNTLNCSVTGVKMKSYILNELFSTLHLLIVH